MSRSSASSPVASVASSRCVSSEIAGAGAAPALSAIAVTAARSAAVPPASNSVSAAAAWAVSSASPMSSASSRRSSSFACSSSARAPSSAGAARTSATSAGSAARSSATAASTVSAWSGAASGGASPRRLREQRRDQPFAIGALLLDGLDVEAEARQRFGEQLEVLVGHRRLGIRVGLDLLLAQAEQTFRVGRARGSCSAPRICWLSFAERRELRALRAVAEERVEHLLHVPQVRLDLAADLREQHPLLRALRHLVEQRRRRGAGKRARRARGIEPRQHRLDLLREIGRQARVVLERALGQQHAGRVLHRDRLGNAGCGILSRRSTSAAVSFISAPLPISATCLCTDASVCFSFGRFSARPERELEPRVLGAASCSRASRSMRLDADDVRGQHLGRRNEARRA